MNVTVFSADNLKYLLGGVSITLAVSLVAILLSFLIGSVLGVIRFERIPYFSKLIGHCVDIVRNLPLLLIIFFTYFALPKLGVHLPIFWATVVAMTIFESSMLAEIVRGGLQAVGIGQREGARANGLRELQAMWHIILPQAYKKMIPPIISQFISLVKDTSLATGIGLAELTYRGQVVYGQDSNFILPVLLMLAVVYFLINFTLSWVSRRIEKRLAHS
jgi:putative glutamine transport system permease protein